MLILNVCLVLMLLIAGITARALRRECRRFAGLKEAWKEYAITLETWAECALEMEEESGCRKRSRILEQRRIAGNLAAAAVGRLFDCGEYPDAEESSPFLG